VRVPELRLDVTLMEVSPADLHGELPAGLPERSFSPLSGPWRCRSAAGGAGRGGPGERTPCGAVRCGAVRLCSRPRRSAARNVVRSAPG